MGRKIPGKKHRGVKDPYLQNTKRLDSIKDKINKAPSNPDDQPIPKTLIRLMNWKNNSKSHNNNKQDFKKSNDSKIVRKKDSGIKKHNNPVNQMKKIPGETNKSFGMRINEAVKSLTIEKTFDDIAYDLDDDESKGATKDFIHRKKKKRNNDEPRLTKTQKKTLKEKEKKNKVKEQKEWEKKCEIKRDHIAFGEVVHEPPTLIKPRRAESAETVPRPARKDLLLNKLFENNQASTHNSSISLIPNIKIYPKNKVSEIDLKGKRKDLPEGVRRKIEESQKEAIEAYRLSKMAKTKKQK